MLVSLWIVWNVQNRLSHFPAHSEFRSNIILYHKSMMILDTFHWNWQRLRLTLWLSATRARRVQELFQQQLSYNGCVALRNMILIYGCLMPRFTAHCEASIKFPCIAPAVGAFVSNSCRLAANALNYACKVANTRTRILIIPNENSKPLYLLSLVLSIRVVATCVRVCLCLSISKMSLDDCNYKRCILFEMNYFCYISKSNSVCITSPFDISFMHPVSFALLV